MDATPEGTHITIKGVLHQYGYDYFKDISGCVVVEHKEGFVQKERPHYHIWLPGLPNVSSTKGTLRTYYDTKQKDLKWNTHANAYYSVTPHNSFSKWLDYCIDPEKAQVKRPRICLWNLPGSCPEVRSLDELILPVQNGAGGIALPGVTTSVVAVAPVSKKGMTTSDKQAKFYKFVKEYYAENRDETISYFDLTRLLDDYAKGGFNEMAAPQYVEYAMYNYLKDTGDTVKFQERQEDWCRRVMSRMRK